MTSRRRKNWLKYIIIVIFLAVLCGGGFMIWKSFKTEELKVDPGTAEPVVTPVIVPESDDKKEDKKEETGTVEKKVEKKVEQFDGGDPNDREELTGVITYAGVSSGNLVIRVNIDQYLTSGTCKLKITGNDGAVYEETVAAVDSAATATCKGFNVATNKLPSGKLSISILVTSGGKTGTIEGEVSL